MNRILGLIFVFLHAHAIAAQPPKLKKISADSKQTKQAPITLAGVPKDALDFLNTLPGHSISLDLVVGRSIQTSDSFRMVKALQPSIESAALEAKASSDYLVEASIGRRVDENEAPNLATPFNLHSTTGSLGISTHFKTGTALSAKLEHNHTDYDLTTFPSVDYLESKASLSVSQSLLKDMFGKATRARIDAGALASEVAQLEFERTIESWSFELIQFFYKAWVYQTNAKAARLGVARRERLLDITQIRFKRGTAERPDLLQVENALTNARAQYSDARQSLVEIWGELVMGLKFPKHWIEIDPEIIPMTIDQPVDEALLLCGKDTTSIPTSSIDVNVARKNAESATLLLGAAESSLLPDLRVILGLEMNGVSNDFGTSWSEVISADHPEWTLGMQFSMPLFRMAEESTVRRAVTQDLRAQAFADKAQSDFEVSWINACADLKRLQTLTLQYEDASRSQSVRVELEEKRFNVGRASPFSVIQAGDEATAAEVNFHNAQAKTRIAAWRVKKLAGKVPAYLESLNRLAEKVAWGPKQ